MEKNNNKQVNIIIKTCIKEEPNGIFNYKQNSSDIRKTNKKINENYYIIRRDIDNKIKKIKKNYQSDESNDWEILFYARKSFKTDIYEVINPVRKLMEKDEYNIDNLNYRAWFIVNSINEIHDYYDDFENEDYILNQYDIIKIGRKKYEIIKLNINSNNNITSSDDFDNYNISDVNKKVGSIFNINIKKNQYKITENIKQKIVSKKNSKDFKNNYKYELNNTNQDNNKEEEICRICYGYESTKDNPKISLCSCKAYIHYECLKKFLSLKIEVYENFKSTVKTYICDNFNCKICLKPYPLRFRIPEYDKIYELINLSIPSELDYLILESLDYIKEKKNLKRVHVVSLFEEEITIGRQSYNDIIDMDISVSRSHAVLKYNREKGKLIIKNLSEKFGTLILIKDNIKLKEKKIHFQVNKSYIIANLENNRNDKNVNIDTDNEME